MDRAGFDPRYSPEFQRGFDAAAREETSASAEVNEQIQPVPTPVVRRISAAPSVAPTTPEQNALPEGALVSGGRYEIELDDGVASSPTVPASPWRNPYLIALTVFGLLLTFGGISAFRWSVGQVYGGAAFEDGATQEQIEESMLAAQLAWGLAPLAALAGVLTLLGVFFFVAWHWRPRARLFDQENEDLPDAGLIG